MTSENVLPSYIRIFGDVTTTAVDESRSVYSPAAYLEDLLDLLEHNFGTALQARRPELRDIPLDAENTYRERPYLDIVNRVLSGQFENPEAAYELLRTVDFPFNLPFFLREKRLGKYLEHLNVSPTLLYRLFTPQPDPDILAREQLGLTAADVELVSKETTAEADVKTIYQLAETDTFDRLQDVALFQRATALTGAELRELLLQNLGPTERAAATAFYVNQGGTCVTVDAQEKHLVWGDGTEPVPPEWFDRAGRFVRLARKSGLSLTDLDLVLRTCCSNRIDLAALRVIGAVTGLHKAYDLPIDVVCSLAAPINTIGRGEDEKKPQDLFDRAFNVPFLKGDRSVLAGSPEIPPDLAVLSCPGDILALEYKEYRDRLGRALGITDAEIATVVKRYRRRPANPENARGPFDRGEIGLPDLSLLHRISQLVSALGVSVDELFDVLDALEADPSIVTSPMSPDQIGLVPQGADYYRMLDAADPGSSLWLVLTLVAVTRCMQAHGISGDELVEIVGGTRTPEDANDHDERVSALRGLRQQFDNAVFTSETFQSGRFSKRASRVIHGTMVGVGAGVISARDRRLLRLDARVLQSVAYRALGELGRITDQDFLKLGLGDRLAAKIFTNAVYAGWLGGDGVLTERELPDGNSVLSNDFGDYRDELFAKISDICARDSEQASLFPSDMTTFDDLSSPRLAELYDNLIFNGILDADGAILRPEFFADPDNVEHFPIGSDLNALAPAIVRLLRERVKTFHDESLPLDPTIFDDLEFTEPQLADLRQSLRFNGYLDASDRYRDKVALMAMPLAEFTLPLEFYPHRGAVLNAIQIQLAAVQHERYTFTVADFVDTADHAVARRIVSSLDGDYLVDEHITAELRAALSDTDSAAELELGPEFTTAEKATIAHQLSDIVQEQQPYQLNPVPLTDIGFDPDEQVVLAELLTDGGILTDDLTIAEDRIAYFRNVGNVLSFALPAFEDYNKDVFFLLHVVANHLHDGIAEVVESLTDLAQRQRTALGTGLQAAFGVPAKTAEAICRGVLGDLEDALDLLVAPALGPLDRSASTDDEPMDVPKDTHFRLAYRRIRRFALLASKLAMTENEVDVAFADQDLAAKFAEPLSLPPGVEAFDALLEEADGTVYLFAGTNYWVYRMPDYTLEKKDPRPLTKLSPRFAGLSAVDAAGVEPTGTAWLVGRGQDGVGQVFTREPGKRNWTRREQVWGKIKNNFADPTGIDAAFVDDEGRTYLFSGDQYVRYSGSDYAVVDEGFPRELGEVREDEGRQGEVAAALPYRLDASFEGKDGPLYLFKNDSFITIGGEYDGQARPIANVWGRVRNELAETGRVDAAYTAGSAVLLTSGDQVVRWSDCIENVGARADDGSLRRIESHFGSVPAGFETALDAALVDAGGVVHLFKEGKTVALTEQDRTVVPTAQRWGLLGPVLPSGTVDAAFVGLDAKAYLFSGDRYYRYSGSDYSRVDLGYPRNIARDWGGLREVDASFTLEDKTFLFGQAGHLFDIELEHEADLNSGRLSQVLRHRFKDHELEFAPDVAVTGHSPQWQLTTTKGITIAFAKKVRRIEVAVDQANQAQFYVQYSTKDYRKADAGYPKPVSDNWWNLPVGLVKTGDFAEIDAVFTGRDEKTYLFSGGQFIVFDNKRRWWTQPRSLREQWDSVPFDHVDSAFVGMDGKTYLFSGAQYVRFSNADYTAADEGYPAPIEPYWGCVANHIARTGKIDATLVMDVKAPDPDEDDAQGRDTHDAINQDPDIEVDTTYTYLFSGDQYVRYTGPDLAVVDAGYPTPLSSLKDEPRLHRLTAELDRVDAALADQHNVYLFSGGRCHIVADAPYRRYDQLMPATPGCVFIEDGAVLVEDSEGWHHYSSLEGATVTSSPVRPRTLRKVPPEFRTGLDAVLTGMDGVTYLFKGGTCFNTELNRSYPVADEWGRPRTNIFHHSSVDSAFVGVDGKTYVFSGDQFVVYPGTSYLETEVEDGPRPVAMHWAGLDNVALAYVADHQTHLFERPDDQGTVRYVVYSGRDYSRPDEGYPRTIDASFWDIPDAYAPDGFVLPDAVLVNDETLLAVIGRECLAYSPTTDSWNYPRPLERLWPGLDRQFTDDDYIAAAFAGRDGATYFFLAEDFIRYTESVAAPRERISRRWGRTHNDFVGAAGHGRVDAAMVFRGETTFLFAGDQYVRYSGPDYRYVDDGYPKKIAENLRKEAPFGALADKFEDAIGARIDAKDAALIDAAVANDRTVFLFVGGDCHVASVEVTADSDPRLVGRVRNTIADRQRVDAALLSDDHTYLFSGDQYVRYTGSNYTLVDEGYPKTLDSGLPTEFGVNALPEPFGDRLDAAFRDRNGVIQLFAGKQYLSLTAGQAPSSQAIAGAWGTVRNVFTADDTNTVDAAFVTSSDELYVFRGDQYLRYSHGKLKLADEGYPRTIKDDWGNLPVAFETALTGAFRFQGRTYLAHHDEYVRYSTEEFHQIDRTYPQTTRQRWGHIGDYRLTDLTPIIRFVDVVRAHPGGGLAEFLDTGAEDPYLFLAKLFDWDIDEVKWVRRIGGFLPTDGPPDDRVEIEFLLKLTELFDLAGTFGVGPSRIFTEIWSRIYGPNAQDLGTANEVIAQLLARKHKEQEWAKLSAQIDDDLNIVTRDALLSAVTTRSHDPALTTAKELFEHLLIDVEMGGAARTSPIREAIAAVQLYLHRYLLDLEHPTLTTATDSVTPGTADEARRELKERWSWLRSYRLWEANRKVFLYPENYLRPELRASKTSAFKTLEDNLLQNEITPEAVQEAYQRYLDEYTELSRLVIGGGYVYGDDSDISTRKFVLFGRTRTAPLRYYFRTAELRGGDKLSSTWDPWRKVGIQIDADNVYPVYAFDRVFVFWTATEAAPHDSADAKTEITAKKGSDKHTVSGPPPKHVLKLHYSFQDLNGDWVPVQTLATDTPAEGRIEVVKVSVRESAENEKKAIVVYVGYTVHHANGRDYRRWQPNLTPELSAFNAGASVELKSSEESEAARSDDLDLDDPVANEVLSEFSETLPNGDLSSYLVRFSSAFADDRWTSIDLLGSSFLYRSVVSTANDVIKTRALKQNRDGLPKWDHVDAAFELPNGTRYFFNNVSQEYQVSLLKGRARKPSPILDNWHVSTVDAGYVLDGALYLTSGTQLFRYTLEPDGSISEQPDSTYPKTLPAPIDAIFQRENQLYVFADGKYAKTAAAQELGSAPLNWQPVAGSWDGLPATEGIGFDTVLDGKSSLYLFTGANYVSYSKSAAVQRPLERATLPYQIERLTTSTAARLNQALLAGGVPALLDLRTQETDELPAFSFDHADANTIRLQADKVFTDLPDSTHLDFQSANGIYYWEIFFHIPFLIANALNNAQRFDDAKKWYEYVFDPTEPTGHWRFLPFVGMDVDNMLVSCRDVVKRIGAATGADAAVLGNLGLDQAGLVAKLAVLLDPLEKLAPAFRYGRELNPAEVLTLRTLHASKLPQDLAKALEIVGTTVSSETRDALQSLQERTAIIVDLLGDYYRSSDPGKLIKAYQDDPFDPHAIAALRPVAYRRAVLMAYIDNLLDWGDMLFRQYTPESVDEARMLYVLAYDLLGNKREALGTQLPSHAQSFADLEKAEHPGGDGDTEAAGDEDLGSSEDGSMAALTAEEQSRDQAANELLSLLTAGDSLLDGAGEVHAGVAHPYFSIPGNSTFAEYWDRVADRLRKIRLSQNFLGVVQPLPLFEPPIDPMALVTGDTTGRTDQTVQGPVGAVPNYRFNFLFGKAQDLVEKLRRLANDLQTALERNDAEKLSLLQNRQDGAILELTRAIKDAQVQAATATVQELQTSLKSAKTRAEYYSGLVKDGLSPLEITQLASLSTATVLQGSGVVTKLIAAFTHGAPQVYAGPFNMGVETGGTHWGNVAQMASDVLAMSGQTFSMMGEIFGVRAGQERTKEDWKNQQVLAECDVEQIGYQLAGAEQQVAIAQRDREILDKQIANSESIATFMTSKFSNAELYQWMSERLSALYYQAYTMAYDMAKAAERAYQFERGEDRLGHIQPTYWDSRRKGLLAGEGLSLDLERLGTAFIDSNARGLEITRRVSLLGLDPLAVMRLKNDGKCDFTLGEQLFDYDFPGHFRRQIRTVTVYVLDAEGNPVDVNATLTQLGHKTVLTPDPKVVKYLLDPKGSQPAALRTDWRASQQVALSQVDDPGANNGLFELRYDDDRYLPFEGTGAVSTWRLEISGACPTTLQDVVVTVKYCAQSGGDVFANAVKGMLKPYPAARYLDVAREFAEEWEEFKANGDQSLTLPVTPALFPHIKGHQINSVYPKYDLTNGGEARFTLNGLALNDGKLLPTPGLTVNGPTGGGWKLQLDGDKNALADLGLVLTYQAGAQ